MIRTALLAGAAAALLAAAPAWAGRETRSRSSATRPETSNAAGVLFGMQADMWDPTADQSAFVPYKARIAARAAAFGKPVLLFEGDSHVFTVDRPAGMPENLTRVVVQGSTTVPHEWLRLHVDRKVDGVFSCEVIPFGGEPRACPAPLAG